MTEFLESIQHWLPGLIAMLALTCASSFFSASETALFYLSHDELRSFRTGGRQERLVAHLLSDPDRLLSAILFWNLMVNLSYFAVSVVIGSGLANTGQTLAAGIFSLISLFAIILLGEVMPKSVAVVFPRQFSKLVCWPLAFAVKFLDPISPLFAMVTRMLRRTFWPHLKQEPYLHAEDLEKAVEASHLSEEVIQQEREVLHRILDLSEITVEEVMWPRGTYATMPAPINMSHLKERLPPGDYLIVQEPGTDDINRAIPLNNFAVLPEKNLESKAEEVIQVPWCALLSYTLQKMREHFCGIAAVVNEYGETIGIVTYDDLLDSILTAEASRAKRILQREPVLEIAPGRFHVDGITTLRYLSRRLGIEYDPTADSFVTVTGMLLEEFEHFPELGEEFVWKDCRIKVIEVSQRGQIRVMLIRNEEP